MSAPKVDLDRDLARATLLEHRTCEYHRRGDHGPGWYCQCGTVTGTGRWDPEEFVAHQADALVIAHLRQAVTGG